MRGRYIYAAALLLLPLPSLGETVLSDSKLSLDGGWQFVRGDIGSIWESVRQAPGKDDPLDYPAWKAVDLPHCFNSIDAVDPDVTYYQGPGWYRRTVKTDNPYPGGRTLLEFEGSGQKTDVYAGMQQIASHIGGYDGWAVDITESVRDGVETLISVRCDNSRDSRTIPSDLSDFNLYGGLYRHVNLIYTPSRYFETVHIDSRPEGKSWKATVNAVLSAGDGEKGLTLTVLSPDGKEVASRCLSTVGGKISEDVLIRRPQLWDVDSPLLYTCRLTLDDGYSASVEFGLRTFSFEPKGPFYLNGRRLLLRGTHRHEDHALTAAAVPDSITEAEMRLMKSMGVNFIRLGHYQQSELVLRMCNRLGILVWEEIPWCRGGLGGEEYRHQARRMLSNMINQHYNHPSVILWGLGNENNWPGDFPEFDKAEIRSFMSELNDQAHRLDPGRRTSIRRCEFCSDVVDVYSPSIWAGWYSGTYKSYRERVQKAISEASCFFHAEWGGDSHAGRHSEYVLDNIDKVTKRADGHWSETYISLLFDWHLTEQETMPDLSGAAFWTFKDFSTPIRALNPVPYVNQKGVVERDLSPKESFYVFQSHWTSEPMAHIYGHSWPVRWGREGESRKVLVYSNCDRAELFLNGVSQGVRKRDALAFPACGLSWDCVYRPGENEVAVVATKGSAVVTDTISQRYETRAWGKPSRIVLESRDISDGIREIEVRIVDSEGVICLDNESFVRYELAGDGSLVADMGTSSGSSFVQTCNGQSKIRVRVDHGGKCVVSVSSNGLPTEMIRL